MPATPAPTIQVPERDPGSDRPLGHSWSGIPQMTTRVTGSMQKRRLTSNPVLIRQSALRSPFLVGPIWRFKARPVTFSHCEGALRLAPHTPVLSGDLDATGWAAVMAAIHCSDGPEARHELTFNMDQLEGADHSEMLKRLYR